MKIPLDIIYRDISDLNSRMDLEDLINVYILGKFSRKVDYEIMHELRSKKIYLDIKLTEDEEVFEKLSENLKQDFEKIIQIFNRTNNSKMHNYNQALKHPNPIDILEDFRQKANNPKNNQL